MNKLVFNFKENLMFAALISSDNFQIGQKYCADVEPSRAHGL
jgi:hypothetical protein